MADSQRNTSANLIPGALAGIRVADFSRVLAGPFATMLLADLGADVTKVERPGAGDETRSWGPLFENFRPGLMEEIGLGYEQLRTENPTLIYCSITGFGASAGAALPAYDLLV